MTAPQVPHLLRHRWLSPGVVELSWSQVGDTVAWHVEVTQAGETVADRLIGVPSAVVEGIAYDQEVRIAVSAVGKDAETEPLVRIFPDFHYRPAAPRGLMVTPSDTVLRLAWLQDDCCEEWQLLWRRFEAAPTRTIQQELEDGSPSLASGTAMVAGEPQYTITDLEPDTRYQLLIAACWRGSSYSEALTPVFATEYTGPRTPRLRAGRLTHNSIEILWEDDPAATGWAVRRVPGQVRHQLTGQPRWNAQDLTPESGYEFEVVALDEDHGLESKETTIRLRTSGSRP